jgi:hypothetical protein
MVLELAQFKRMHQQQELQKMMMDMGEFVKSTSLDSKDRGVFVDGFKVSQVKNRLRELRAKRERLDLAKRKLKASKKNGNGQYIVKGLCEFKELEDLESKKEAMGGGKLLDEVEMKEFKNRVYDLINLVSKVALRLIFRKSAKRKLN